MRKLIALFFCCCAMSAANANDPPVAGQEAPASAEAAKSAPAEAKAPEYVKPKYVPPKSVQSDADKEAEAEAELSQKIAARLAAMRATQAARAVAAAKARKVAVARKKAEEEKAKVPPEAHGTHWSYEGEAGPANWAKINVDWAKCGTGNRQSPIDIRDGMKVDLEPIAFDYKPSTFSVIDNGHTVQVTLAGGNYITLMNRMFELVQFHFHRPSEERINGKGFEMVVHLVHKDSEGNLAVLAVLLERGAAQSLIQTVWNNLPLEKNTMVTPAITLDMNEILPERRDYFTYMGSLTTPPCTENVLWLVMKQPVQASPAQMALFSRLYPLNARPIQSASGRVIKESN